jgi:hypothetical protein
LIVHDKHDERGDQEEHRDLDVLSLHFLNRFIQFSDPEDGVEDKDEHGDAGEHVDLEEVVVIKLERFQTIYLLLMVDPSIMDIMHLKVVQIVAHPSK